MLVLFEISGAFIKLDDPEPRAFCRDIRPHFPTIVLVPAPFSSRGIDHAEGPPSFLESLKTEVLLFPIRMSRETNETDRI